MVMKKNNLKSTISKENLFEHLATAVLVVNSRGEILSANPAAENMLSSSARRMENQPITEFFSGSSSFITGLEQALNLGFTCYKSEIELNIPSILKTVTVDCSFTPVLESSYSIIELNQIDQKLKIAKEENIVSQQNVLKVLVRGLAHEVKNPLGGIRGAAQLLERELPSESLKEYTEVIIGETDRLQKLVDDMLGPNRPLRKESINIHGVLERVAQLVTVESSDELNIVRDYDPSLPEVYADKNQLIQALLNIVRNAKQALRGKGNIILKTRPERQVTINHQFHRYVLRIDVIDDGPGIDSELIEHIFYPMVTGRAEGTGLGLSIAQTLVAQHGGLIECESQPGKTVFTMLLPLENEESK